MHPKEGYVTIHLEELGPSCQDVCYPFKGWSFVVLMDDGLVEILWVKADPQLAICLFGVGQQADQVWAPSVV